MLLEVEELGRKDRRDMAHHDDNVNNEEQEERESVCVRESALNIYSIEHQNPPPRGYKKAPAYHKSNIRQPHSLIHSNM